MTRQDYDRHMENLIYENIELKQRIDKAIEYIEDYNSNNMEYNTKTLLDILKGSDK